MESPGRRSNLPERRSVWPLTICFLLGSGSKSPTCGLRERGLAPACDHTLQVCAAGGCKHLTCFVCRKHAEVLGPKVNQDWGVS